MNAAIIEPVANTGIADMAEAMFLAEHAQEQGPEVTWMLREAIKAEELLGHEGINQLEREIMRERDIMQLRERGVI